MIINCENCNKKFNIDSNLIGENGRILQCGNCDHKWFFKHLKTEELNPKKKNNEPDIATKSSVDNIDKFLTKKNKRKKSTYTKKKGNDNFIKIINYFVIIFISLISLIIVIDTFKESISIVLPGIIPLLDNLYQTLHVLQLFIKDLIR